MCAFWQHQAFQYCKGYKIRQKLTPPPSPFETPLSLKPPIQKVPAEFTPPGSRWRWAIRASPVSRGGHVRPGGVPHLRGVDLDQPPLHAPDHEIAEAAVGLIVNAGLLPDAPDMPAHMAADKEHEDEEQGDGGFVHGFSPDGSCDAKAAILATSSRKSTTAVLTRSYKATFLVM